MRMWPDVGLDGACGQGGTGGDFRPAVDGVSRGVWVSCGCGLSLSR